MLPLFGRIVPRMTSLPLLLFLLLQRRHCSSLIFCTNKILKNIWILYYSILFLHISILYNFICLIIFFFLLFYTILYYLFYTILFLKIFLNIKDRVTDNLNPLVFFRELEKLYCICHNRRRTNSVNDLPMRIPMD